MLMLMFRGASFLTNGDSETLASSVFCLRHLEYAFFQAAKLWKRRVGGSRDHVSLGGKGIGFVITFPDPSSRFLLILYLWSISKSC
jgi:hypothetical protein